MKLVFLVFGSNQVVVKVVEKQPQSVTLDFHTNTWQYTCAEPGSSDSGTIGHARSLGSTRRGVIGVYDLDNIEHVNRMLYDAFESQREYVNAV